MKAEKLRLVVLMLVACKDSEVLKRRLLIEHYLDDKRDAINNRLFREGAIWRTRSSRS